MTGRHDIEMTAVQNAAGRGYRDDKYWDYQGTPRKSLVRNLLD